MDFGLHWIRRRQRSLSKAVLACFCLAWLQLAAIPCVAAHGDTSGMTRAPSATAGMMVHPGAPMAHGGDAPDPCPYCPPAEHCAQSGDTAGDCTYPHGPQVDARQAGQVFVPLVTACVPSTIEPAAPVAAGYERPALRTPSRIPVSVSYCRFIE